MTPMEYTNADFCQTFIKRYGWSINNGETNHNIAPLMPFIMMGVAYTYYENNIRDLKLKHQAKYERNRFKIAYKNFNDTLMKCYDTDMQDAFCDKMEAFQKWLYLDLISLQSKMMRCLPADMKADDRQITSAAMLINRFACIAQKLWGQLYLINGYIGTQNSNLNVILGSSREFAKAYVKDNELMTQYVEDDVADDLYKAISNLENRMYRFIDFDLKQQPIDLPPATSGTSHKKGDRQYQTIQ